MLAYKNHVVIIPVSTAELSESSKVRKGNSTNPYGEHTSWGATLPQGLASAGSPKSLISFT